MDLNRITLDINRAPHLVENLVTRQHAAGVAQKVEQQFKFARGQIQQPVAAQNLACRQVKAEIGKGKHFVFALRLHAA